jgi:hypothetical protein
VKRGEGWRPVRSAGEQNAFTGWRRSLCCLQRAGAVAKTKRRAGKRERRLARAAITAALRDDRLMP